MRLTPSQRVHAVCAFVVPVVLVLIFAPWSQVSREATAGAAAECEVVASSAAARDACVRFSK